MASQELVLAVVTYTRALRDGNKTEADFWIKKVAAGVPNDAQFNRLIAYAYDEVECFKTGDRSKDAHAAREEAVRAGVDQDLLLAVDNGARVKHA